MRQLETTTLIRTPDGNEFHGRLKKREQILTKNAIYLSSDYTIDDYGEASFLDKPVPKNGEFRSCQSMIPFEYLGVTAKDFDWMAYGADDPIAKESKMLANAFVINFPKWRQKGKGLYIYSTTKRTGKTFLSFCLANEVMGRNDANLKYVNIIDYFDLTKRTYSSADDREERDKIMKAAVLILDDIGVDVSREWMNTKLYQMLDYRSLHKLVTIITSNYKVEQLKVDDRVKSRINDMCLPLHIPEIPIGEIKSDKENAEFVRSVMKTNSESH